MDDGLSGATSEGGGRISNLTTPVFSIVDPIGSLIPLFAIFFLYNNIEKNLHYERAFFFIH